MTGPAFHCSDVDAIRVVTEHVPGVRSVSIGVWIDVGARDEADDEAGSAHFVEHLLFKGNGRHDAHSIARFFDGIGSEANAATTREYTVLQARVLDRHVGDTLEVLGSMVHTPQFFPAEVASERDVILDEIAMYDDAPSDVVHEVSDQLVFVGHPLGRPIVGTAHSVSAATSASLAGFHGRRYVAPAIVVSAAGSCQHEDIVTMVRQRFGAPQQVGRGTDPHRAPRGAPLPLDHSAVRVVRKDSEQAHVVLASRAMGRTSQRRYAAAILDTILGGTPGSRLFSEVRESRGLAYSIYSFLSHYTDTGQFGIYVAMRPDRTDEVLEVLARECERIRADGPTVDEVARAIDHVEGRMLLAMESTSVRSSRLGSALVTGVPLEPIEDTIRKVKAVTVEQVHDIARDVLLPAGMTVAGVATDAEALAQSIGRHLDVRAGTVEQVEVVS